MSKKETVERIASSLFDSYYKMKAENERLKMFNENWEQQNRHFIALLQSGITDKEIVKRLKIYYHVS